MSTPTFFGNWNYPTAVRFGPGRIKELAEACATMGMKRPLLVTDPGLAEMDIVKNGVALNAQAGVHTSVFSDIQGNPVGANVMAGVAAIKEGGHDGVIAFGGGSALDAGKAIALMAGQDRPLWDFEDKDDWYTRVNVDGMLPVVAVPTTSGTGSEVGRSSVITHDEEKRKIIIFHANMLPGLVLADPELTLGLPKGPTAATGMDALSHNLEALCAGGFHPLADGIAAEGIALVSQSLLHAYEDGTNIEARSKMMAASLMGATAFQKGLGGMHALSHPLSSKLGQHHGLINAVVMPYVLAYNQAVIGERMAWLSRRLDLDQPSARSILDWVLELRDQLGIPHTLRALTMDDSHVDEFAQMAEVDPAGFGNPIKLTRTDYSSLYQHALRGELPNAR